MKKTTEKVSYSNYCLYICGVMKDDGFHRTKTKPNEKLLLFFLCDVSKGRCLKKIERIKT